jgi:hypothetical protein
MICPECTTEYREGISVCADCGVELVEHIELPPSARLVSLTTTTDAALLASLADHLERADVPYVIEAGTALALLDDRPMEGPDPWAARVWVLDSLHEHAQEILACLHGGVEVPSADGSDQS